MVMRGYDGSGKRYFGDVIEEFVSAISTEFGIEVDPRRYDSHDVEKAEKVGHLYDLVFDYACEFLMSELRKARPRGPYHENIENMAETMDSIASQLTLLEEERCERERKSAEGVDFHEIRTRLSAALEQAETLLRSSHEVSLPGR